MKFLVIIFLFVSPLLYGQEINEGDSSVIRSLNEKLSSIYAQKDTTLYFLTNKNLVQTPSSSSDLTVYLKDKKVNRIVIISSTAKGTFGEEYFIYNNELIFVYQTFEYFAEVPSKSSFINFKGRRGWESRYYFDHEKLKYQKTSGAKDVQLTYSADNLLTEKEKLFKFIQTFEKK